MYTKNAEVLLYLKKTLVHFCSAIKCWHDMNICMVIISHHLLLAIQSVNFDVRQDICCCRSTRTCIYYFLKFLWTPCLFLKKWWSSSWWLLAFANFRHLSFHACFSILHAGLNWKGKWFKWRSMIILLFTWSHSLYWL